MLNLLELLLQHDPNQRITSRDAAGAGKASDFFFHSNDKNKARTHSVSIQSDAVPQNVVCNYR